MTGESEDRNAAGLVYVGDLPMICKYAECGVVISVPIYAGAHETLENGHRMMYDCETADLWAHFFTHDTDGTT